MKKASRTAGTVLEAGQINPPRSIYLLYHNYFIYARGVNPVAETKILINRRDGFTVLPNKLLRDPGLSLKAKGLLCVMLSLPPSWDFTVSGLCTITDTGRDAIRSALSEMEETGYLTREQAHGACGKFSGNVYIVSDEPVSPLVGNPPTEEPGVPLSGFPSTANPSAANPPQLNKDGLSKDLSNTPHTPQGGQRRQKSKGPKLAPDWKPERFAGFWAYYPRGESKQDAISAWDKLSPDDALIVTMGLALQRQKASDDWKRGVGIPYASTWLNQRRWEDTLKQVSSRSSDPVRVVEEEEVRYV